MSGEEGSALNLLRVQRNRITNAGKYMDRYKNEFKSPAAPKYGLSARYRDKNEELLYSGRRSRSPSVQPEPAKKHNKNVNIYEVTPSPSSGKRNIGVNLKFASPPHDGGVSDTLDCLQHVENYISMCETKAAKKQNVNRFDEMVKANNTTNSCDNQLDREQPLYNCREVENLLQTGLSDMQCNEEPKTRSSLGVKKKEGRGLMRALSDAKATESRKIRNNLEQSKKVLITVLRRWI